MWNRWTRCLWSAAVAAAAIVALPALGGQELRPPDPDPGFRVLISIDARTLWVVNASGDTLYEAPVAVGSQRTLSSAEGSWRFATPKGTTTVVARQVSPLWIPPDWHYVEIAKQEKVALARLQRTDSVPIGGGDRLIVRGDTVGVLDAAGGFSALPADEEIIFLRTLFIPPFGTTHRKVAGVLGPYRLVLANGVGIHGTPHKESIGRAATHGCIRLHDADITWLYDNVPVGTVVVIY
jgi:hypothetical protein